VHIQIRINSKNNSNCRTLLLCPVLNNTSLTTDILPLPLSPPSTNRTLLFTNHISMDNNRVSHPHPRVVMAQARLRPK